MMEMKMNLLCFVLADAAVCWRLFEVESPLVMKRTLCRLAVSDLVANKCGMELPQRVEVRDFDIMLTEKLLELHKSFGRMLSINDVSSLFIAKDECGILITDDAVLRRCAKAMGVETVSSNAFATQIASMEAEGAPPLRLADYRMKKIEQKENNYENHKPIDNKR